MTEQQLAQACAESMYQADKASRDMGIGIVSVDAGKAVLNMTIVESMLNGHRNCHGGYLFSLADSAFAFACNSENHRTVAAGARIEFLAPAQLGEVLTATAVQLSQARKTGVYDVEVRNESGALIALFRGNSHRVGGELVDASAVAAELNNEETL